MMQMDYCDTLHTYLMNINFQKDVLFADLLMTETLSWD